MSDTILIAILFGAPASIGLIFAIDWFMWREFEKTQEEVDEMFEHYYDANDRKWEEI